MTMDNVSAADTDRPDMEMGPPAKMVWFINFPEGGKTAYDEWAVSIAETLTAPEELVGIRAYNNIDPELRPHRYVELEFESFLDAATYMNRPEIAALLEDAPNHATDQTVHTFIQRSVYSKDVAFDRQIKRVALIDYPLGGKQAYLDWIASVTPAMIEPPELKAIAVYDNYYGVSPHRLVTLEFASVADAMAYEAYLVTNALDTESNNRAHSRGVHIFQLISE